MRYSGTFDERLIYLSIAEVIVGVKRLAKKLQWNEERNMKKASIILQSVKVTYERLLDTERYYREEKLQESSYEMLSKLFAMILQYELRNLLEIINYLDISSTDVQQVVNLLQEVKNKLLTVNITFSSHLQTSPPEDVRIIHFAINSLIYDYFVIYFPFHTNNNLNNFS